MNILVIYYHHFEINCNKYLVVDSFYRNLDYLKKNGINVEFINLNVNFEETINQIDIPKYENYIFFLHQKVGSYILTFPDKVNLIKKYKIKTIFWMDDLHFACNNLNNDDRMVLENLEVDDRYKNVDIIVSPSVEYFYNVGTKLVNKVKFLFYYFDEKLIDLYNPDNYDSRINKILLSGKINKLSYPSRKQMYTNYYYNKDLYDWLDHPGYNGKKHNKYHKTYYDELAKYKGAILGLAKYPLNFLLAKVIEILGSGCLGFFEESELYKKYLGLEEYVHYIPIKKITDEYKPNYKMEDYFYLNLENEMYKKFINSHFGKTIALTGYNYVKKNFNSRKFIDNFLEIINT